MMKSLNYTECIINYAGYVEYLDMINGVVAGLEEEERRRKAEEERRRQIEEERRRKAEEERRRQAEEERRRQAEEERRRQAEEERRRQAEEERRRQIEEERRRKAEEERRRQAEEERRRQIEEERKRKAEEELRRQIEEERRRKAEEERRRQAEEERKYWEDIERIRAFAENLPRVRNEQAELRLFETIQTERGIILYHEVMQGCEKFYKLCDKHNNISMNVRNGILYIFLVFIYIFRDRIFYFNSDDSLIRIGVIFFLFSAITGVLMTLTLIRKRFLEFTISELNNSCNQLIKSENIKFKLESGSKKD